VPHPRGLNAQARLERPDRRGSVVEAELVSTAPGDPLLAGLPRPRTDEVVASASLAARLDLAPGTKLTLRAVRGAPGAREVLALDVTVSAVASPAAFGRDAVFAALPLLLLVDDFTDDRAPPDATLAERGTVASDRIHAGFRAYARSLEEVVALDHALRAEGVEVSTRAEEIAGLLGLDRSLDLLFVTLAALGGVGYLVSLGVALYAGVERKRRELSLLRLIGLTRRDLVLFPLVQALWIALAGVAFAAAVALLVAGFVNRLPLGTAGGGGGDGRAVCVVALHHLLVAAAVTLAGAAAAAAFAGGRAGRILPAEGLRDA
jgi:putative ABC transport system permease protein